MAEPFIAQIKMWACNFAPRSWAHCNGQLLPISQNTALFSLLGTTFGGDGRTTVGLPNLQGRAALHVGHGPGLSTRILGETGGVTAVTLNLSMMPAHTHNANAKTPGGNPSASNTVWGTSQAAKAAANFYAPAGTLVDMHTNALLPVGGGQQHNNLMPYTTVNFCIALQGIYPPRS